MNPRTKRRIQALAIAATVLLQANPVFASEAGEGFPWKHWAVSMLNFAIFFGILVKFAGPKIQEFFKDRAVSLRADIEEAKALRTEAQARLKDYTDRLEKLDDERQALLDDYHAQGEREKIRMVEDAKERVEKMKSDAKVVIEQEVRKAVSAIEHQAVNLAVELARKSLESKLDLRTQNTLVDEFVTDLKSMES